MRIKVQDECLGEESAREEQDELGLESRHYRDVSRVLPKFNLVRDDITIDQWIDKIEEYGEFYLWDELAVKHYAISKLAGVARKWRDSLPCDERTWVQWKAILRENFPAEKSALTLRKDAESYRRKPNQNIIEYYYKKLSKCNKAKMDNREAGGYWKGYQMSEFAIIWGRLADIKNPVICFQIGKLVMYTFKGPLDRIEAWRQHRKVARERHGVTLINSRGIQPRHARKRNKPCVSNVVSQDTTHDPVGRMLPKNPEDRRRKIQAARRNKFCT